MIACSQRRKNLYRIMRRGPGCVVFLIYTLYPWGPFVGGGYVVDRLDSVVGLVSLLFGFHDFSLRLVGRCSLLFGR